VSSLFCAGRGSSGERVKERERAAVERRAALCAYQSRVHAPLPLSIRSALTQMNRVIQDMSFHCLLMCRPRTQKKCVWARHTILSPPPPLLFAQSITPTTHKLLISILVRRLLLPSEQRLLRVGHFCCVRSSVIDVCGKQKCVWTASCSVFFYIMSTMYLTAMCMIADEGRHTPAKHTRKTSVTSPYKRRERLCLSVFSSLFVYPLSRSRGLHSSSH
jgi:hypothetical protein